MVCVPHKPTHQGKKSNERALVATGMFAAVNPLFAFVARVFLILLVSWLPFGATGEQFGIRFR